MHSIDGRGRDGHGDFAHDDDLVAAVVAKVARCVRRALDRGDDLRGSSLSVTVRGRNFEAFVNLARPHDTEITER